MAKALIWCLSFPHDVTVYLTLSQSAAHSVLIGRMCSCPSHGVCVLLESWSFFFFSFSFFFFLFFSFSFPFLSLFQLFANPLLPQYVRARPIFADTSHRTATANSHLPSLSNLSSSSPHASLLPRSNHSLSNSQAYPNRKSDRSSSIRACPPFKHLPLLHLHARPFLLTLQPQLAQRWQSACRLKSAQTVLCRLRR